MRDNQSFLLGRLIYLLLDFGFWMKLFSIISIITLFLIFSDLIFCFCLFPVVQMKKRSFDWTAFEFQIESELPAHKMQKKNDKSSISSSSSSIQKKMDNFLPTKPKTKNELIDLVSSDQENDQPVVDSKCNPKEPPSNYVPFLSSSSAKKKFSGDVATDILRLRSFPCKTPSFKNQIIINRNGIKKLDAINSIAVQYDFLPENILQEYLRDASQVIRYAGKSAFNSIKPRKEVCYTVDGQPFRYSRILHQTTKYPPHVLKLMPFFHSCILSFYPDNHFNQISGGLDIIYSPEFERGGSAGRHRDSEMNWGLVVIFSLGQTRWFRIRQYAEDSPEPIPIYYNIEMKHNSVIMMHGKTFQELYTHQVDKLSKDEDVYYRLSLNIRYLEGEDNYHQLLSSSSSQQSSVETNLIPTASPA